MVITKNHNVACDISFDIVRDKICSISLFYILIYLDYFPVYVLLNDLVKSLR